MTVEWDLEVDSIRQSFDYMEIIFENNKVLTMTIEEWKKLGKPGKGDLLFIDINEEKQSSEL